MENAATAAPMVLASGYVGVALAVVSAFQQSKEGPSPFPAIFEMLSRISEQIEKLRHEVANSIADLDAHLSAAIDVVSVKVDSLIYDAQQVGRQLRDLRTTLGDVNAAIGEQLSNIAELILRAEDRNCFQWTGDQQLLPLSRKEFIICRDTYIDRATVYAAGASSPSAPASASTATIPQATLFPFAEEYEQLREELGKNSSSRLANPSVWYRSTTLLLVLVQSSSQYLRDILDRQLAPVIKAGDDLRDFVQTLALDGTRLRQDRFEAIINQIASTQNDILSKVERQQKNAPVLANVSNGLQPDPNIDRQYRMLAAKGLKFCEKIRPTLSSVQNVSITRSGGCCGTDEVINQNIIDQHAFASPGAGWGNLRARIEGVLGSVDYSALTLDKSLLKSVNKAVVLMEQTKHQNAEMSYCISQFNVTHLNMTHATQNEIGLDMHLKVFLTVEGKDKNTTFLVQELAGGGDWRTNFYWLYYDGSARPNGLIFETWKQLQGKFDQLLKPIPNGEADNNRKEVEEEMNKFFREQRASLYEAVLNTTAAEAREFDGLKKQLSLLTKIGLNTNHVAVKAWLDKLETAYPTVESQVGAIVLNGEQLDKARQSVAETGKVLKDTVAQLGAYTNLKPDTNAISARLNDLEKIRLMRSSLSLASITPKKQQR